MIKCTKEAPSSCTVDHDASSEDNEGAANFSKLVLQDLRFIKESFEAVQYKASQVIVEVNEALNKFEELMLLPSGRKEERDFELQQLKKKASKLRFNIPFNLIAPSEQPNPNIKWRRHPPSSNLYQAKESTSNPKVDCDYYDWYKHDNRPPLTYNELSLIIPGLYVSRLRCLLCFLLFPKNAIIKRSVLFSWAVVMINQSSYPIYEAIHALVGNRLIKAVYKKSNLTVAGYWMHPSVHSTLKSNWSFWSRKRIYLGHSLDVEEDIYYTEQSFTRVLSKEIDILYLGKWNKRSEQHIEVMNPKLFFKSMSKLKELVFVSLRGISMIEELPEFITKLKRLKVLDLKACHNLEVIPPSITNLRHSLIHLDMSECYLLNHMPKALATLVTLEVLKGFLVAETEERSCSLEDLVDLHQLQKLSLCTSIKGFPNKSQFATLQKFENLLSLTICWERGYVLNQQPKSSQVKKYDELKSKNVKEDPARKEDDLLQVKSGEQIRAPLEKPLALKEQIHGDHGTFSFSIEKLDLQCVPEAGTRRWLKPINFGNLKKLYIRGRQFYNFGQSSKENQWNVEILRLKHLSKVSMNWSELLRFFPNLIFLKKVNCPNLNQFPCNDRGIWINNEQC